MTHCIVNPEYECIASAFKILFFFNIAFVKRNCIIYQKSTFILSNDIWQGRREVGGGRVGRPFQTFCLIHFLRKVEGRD